jgi:methylated-DNA-protein-cysteine methyltransferase related protein
MSPKNEFAERVFQAVKQIPKGKVATYGWVGAQIGSSRLARAVGNALHFNPYDEVPCHRVVNSQGKLALHFGKGGWQEQKKRLEKEGVRFRGEMYVDKGDVLKIGIR